MAKATIKKKPKAKKVTSVTIRENAKKDHSPTWDGHEELSSTEFAKKFRDAMQYYNLEFSSKDLKPAIIKWMKTEEYDPIIVEKLKKTKDWRCSVTMGSIASCLLRGMPSVRDDFNAGRDAKEWLNNAIYDVLERGRLDIEDDEEKESAPTISIQDRVRDAALRMVDQLDDAIESFYTNPEEFDPKSFKVLNVLKGNQVKPAHARIIKDFYLPELTELEELASGEADEDLKEGYKHRTKKQIKNFIAFHKEIQDACTMLMQEAKVNRKPRAKKPVAKDKLVAKIKFKKSDEALKLVSISPVDIIGSKELWVYNIKNRKLGRYVADDMTGPLTVKGTSIVGFNEHTSIQKTIRKPDEKLKEFKTAGKVALRTFMDSINATDTKLNGRLNEEIILLKVL